MSDTVVIVDFYAELLEPILKKAVKDNGKTILVKVNIDENVEIAAEYSIVSLPTVAAFKNGELVDSFVGSRDFASVKSFIDKATA
ncbi:thioredoxin 2 [Nowakowskiella sp. JEL0407]|nr:thioredoxin 2 [Nowakowskiella sp. JEL0407]